MLKLKRRSVLGWALTLLSLACVLGGCTTGSGVGQAAFAAPGNHPGTEQSDLKLTILYDNNPHTKGLEIRWGFSCLVQGPEQTIIFDVGGEGSVLLGNMAKLGVDPQVVDVIVLSHVHHDHIGGLSDFLRRNSEVKVYMPKSLPQSVKQGVSTAGAELIEVDQSLRICPNVYSTGELGGALKEQSLVVKTSRGPVVVTGCAHPGVVTIVKRAKQMVGRDVHLVVGGFHLSQSSASQINRVIRGLQTQGVEKAAPCHCSGDLARQLFRQAYGENFILVGVGKTISIAGAFAGP